MMLQKLAYPLGVEEFDKLLLMYVKSRIRDNIK